MIKYCIDEYVSTGFNASSKAREDVSQIVQTMGYKVIASNNKINITSNSRKILIALNLYKKVFFTVKENDLLFLQCSLKVLEPLLRIKKIKKFRIIYLIHDLFCLKYDSYEGHKPEIDNSIKLINGVDYLICHNELMIEKLRKFGCTTKMYNLEIFDYLVDNDFYNNKHKNVKGKFDLVFAGNLNNNTLFNTLDHINYKNISFFVYGLPKQNYVNIKYCGAVDPNVLPSVLKADFGLIWENDYETNLSDNYHRYNNLHKFSLYSACSLPIICWEETAIAKIVKKYHIGLTLSSLNDLEDTLDKLTDKEYLAMYQNINLLSRKIRSGYFLKKVLMQIERDL